jgi:hypothetical protein
MEPANRFIAPGVLFLLTPAFGLQLTRAGKLDNGTLFNPHNLIALVAGSRS